MIFEKLTKPPRIPQHIFHKLSMVLLWDWMTCWRPTDHPKTRLNKMPFSRMNWQHILNTWSIQMVLKQNQKAKLRIYKICISRKNLKTWREKCLHVYIITCWRNINFKHVAPWYKYSKAFRQSSNQKCTFQGYLFMTER